MSQWIRGPRCGIDNCNSRLYRHTDGLTICQYGHVMEGNLETNFEDDENFVPTRRLNLQVRDGAFTVLHRQDRDKQDKSKKIYGEDARVLYLRCLQILLRNQLKSCSNLFFYERDELEVVAKLYWLKRLNEYEEDKSNMPNALDTVSISYLAMVTLKKGPVYTSDIIRALRFNDIPFSRCLNLIPKSFLEQLPSFYFKSLEPYQLPLQGELYQRILLNHRITCDTTIGLNLSYFHPWTLQMLAKELLLPNTPEIFFIFLNLASQLGLNYEISWKNNVKIFPDIFISALHIMSIKIYFIYFNNLDHKRWLDILNRRDLNTQFSFADKEIDFKDLLDWSDAKTERYCQWVYNNLIPKDDDLSMMQKRLFKIFDSEDFSNEHDNMNDFKKDGDSQAATSSSLAEVAANFNKSHIDAKEINKIEHTLQAKYSEALGLPTSNLNNASRFLESIIKEKFIL